ncbi:hypothetical protein K440DRAFT_563062, partial [Wilcoxina mikolae CBS 423.85]
LWISLLSDFRITSPRPYPTFKALYATIHPYLWLRSRLWYSDRRFTGHMAVSRYCAKSGTIAFHTLLAPPYEGEQRRWSLDPRVIIPSFKPLLKLWTDQAILELPLPSSRGPTMIQTTLQRVRSIPAHQQSPSRAYWPPMRMPAAERIKDPSDIDFFPPPYAAATSLFRLQKKMRLSPHSEFEVFAALDPEHYTPDEAHPWRGVWVGDLPGHGSELVLFQQAESLDGRDMLSGLKLTGDINIPRGECIFHVDDLLEVLRVSEEHEWPGATVVKAYGQTADHQFKHSIYVDCELILINHNEVAFHWMILEDLSYPSDSDECICRFRRVDVDRFIFGNGVQDFAQEG